MRRTRLALPWSAGAILAGMLASGCATASPSAEEGLRLEPGIAHFTAKEQAERADSARAEAVADEVGPRVTVMADFDYAGGSRQVDATFHMYDDAYVVVGHLDAAGRLKIVFPTSPGDDGFVRGDKVYHVPTFFAGFADEYRYRYDQYRYTYHNTASRYDSYDYGLGYVFVIASWRPMRLDRIADGNKWQTYDVSDISYMQDPREAIEELGSVIAGDNPEAYTIQYAHYSTTNYGTYSFADFDAVNGGCSGYSSLGFGTFGVRSLLFGPFGFMPYASAGCPSYFGVNYGYPLFIGSSFGSYGYPYGVPSRVGPPRIRPPVGTPIGTPIFHHPSLPGAVATHKPEGQSVTPTAPIGAVSVTNGSSAYHRPGLITDDAAPPRGQGRTLGTDVLLRGGADRPSIQQMIGHRTLEDGASAMAGRDAGMRGNPGAASREPSWTNRGGVNSRPRPEGGVYRSQGGRNVEGSRPAPSYHTPSYSAPRSQPHYEPSHSAPPRVESPRPSSSSSGSKKP